MEHALGGSQTLYGTRGSIVDETGQTLAGSVLEYDCQLDPLLITQIDQDIPNGKSKAEPWSKVSVEIAELTGQTVEEVQAIVGGRARRELRSRASRSSTAGSRPRSTASSRTSACRTSCACSIRRARIRTAPSPATSSASWASTASRSRVSR